MKLDLVRDIFTEDFTLGRLYENDTFLFYTVEDKVRKSDEPKVFGKTAIPYGTYKIAMTMSNRFKVLMPLLLNVENFDGVRMHSGNTSADTEGCIIIGNIRTDNGVADSRIACAKLYDLLEKDADNEITISGGGEIIA